MPTIRPTLHHVTMKTSRLDEMIAWYKLLIGAEVNFKNDVAAWLSNDAANHRIAFLAVPGLGDDAEKVRHNGMHHSAFEYDSFADLMSTFDRLRKAGVEPAFCLDHGLTISLYYKDPEGNFVELQSDNFSDWKLSSEWMRSSADFAANPIGTFFDPARVYEKFQAGAEFKSLQKSIRAGAYLPDPSRASDCQHRNLRTFGAMSSTSRLESGRTGVLIIGAGPVGLAAAIELGRRGVRCCVVERHDRVGYSPRAKTTNVRTREHLRRWGIADALRKASPIAADRPSTIVFATRMNGPLLTRFENALHGNRERNNLYSEEAQWVPQYVLEDVLREYAQSLPGVRIHFETEFVSFSQTDVGLASQIRDLRTGSIVNIESSYLIGADGARSAVRDAIRATMLGEGAFSRNYSIIFRAPDLGARQIHEPAIMYWMVNEDVPSLLGPMDEAGLWFFMATKLAGDADPATLDPIDLIRRGTGLSDLDIEIVGTDLWVAHRLVADRYSRGRVFLAGDACHLHPPFGGFGMNMGIGDAVDLGWKIAARMAGWGGDTLLATYEQERRKVHERTINEAVYNYGSTANQLVRPALEETGLIGDATRREVADIIQATKVREFKTLGIVLGMRYEDSPIIVADGSDPPIDHFMLYVPSAHPGCLAPHLWLSDGSSLYDHFGEGFTLLITDGNSDTAGPLVDAAAKRKVPLKVLALSDGRLCSRYEAKFALIRPDQHVAWRAKAMPQDPDCLLARVTGSSAAATPEDNHQLQMSGRNNDGRT